MMSSEKDPTQALKILSGFRHGPDITSVTFNKRAAIKKTERLGFCPNKGPSSLVPPSPKFLDVIPYPSSYPCQSVSEWVMVSDFPSLSAIGGNFLTIFFSISLSLKVLINILSLLIFSE